MNDMNNEVNNINESPENNEIPKNEDNSTYYDESHLNDIAFGYLSVLYKRIGNLKITDTRIRDAFALFLKNVDCGKTFSLCEIIDAAEALKNKGQPDETAGNYIYCIDSDTRLPFYDAKLSKSSLISVYSLFSLRNGVLLDLSALGGSISDGIYKRFFVMPEKKMKKFISRMGDKAPIKCGEIIASNKIIFTKGNTTVASVDKSSIDSDSSPCSVELTEHHYNQFLNGYQSVYSLVMCNNVDPDNILRFGLGGDMADCCARVLGYFAARIHLSSPTHSIMYNDVNGTIIAVSRPEIKEGDYVYLLKLRKDGNGIPEKPHFSQLCYYLVEKKQKGIIKNVLPVKENIKGLITRLGGAELEYVPLAEIPKDAFGIIVTVPRGESVNGVQLGYFKYN